MTDLIKQLIQFLMIIDTYVPLNHKNSIRRITPLTLLVAIATILTNNVQATPCDQVGFMPSRLVFQGAKDQTTDDDTNQESLDVHTFNHFYTFQVDRDVEKINEGVEMVIPDQYLHSVGNSGHVFRLRSYFASASSTRTEMGMNVYLLKDGSASEADPSNVVAKASSMDSYHGNLLNMVALDVENLPPGYNYTLRYEFQAKERLHSGKSSLSSQEDSTSTEGISVKCHLPYFTQELAIVNRKVIQKRVKKYQLAPPQQEQSGNKIKNCLDEFFNLDATKQRGVDVEGGFDCRDQTYFYQQKSLTDLDSDLSLIAEREFTVKGVNGRPTTTYLQLEIGSEFTISAGLILLLKRADLKFETPFECLLDQSCEVSVPLSRNHQVLNVILTSGDYVLQIFDKQSSGFVDYITNQLRLKDVPFQLHAQAYPVFQNEQRANCPFMYMTEDFIQKRYDLLSKTSARFYYNDKIVMNLVEQVQKIAIEPTDNSFIKVVVQEAFGVNVVIKLCNSDGSKCDHQSQKIGTTALLYREVKKNTEYQVRIEYSHSIIAYHTFTECPHITMELSIIKADELQKFQSENAPRPLVESVKQLDAIAHAMNTEGMAVFIADPERARFSFESDFTKSFEVVWKNEFTVHDKMGLFVEIFYSPYQDEVMQLALVSKSVHRDDQISKYKASKSIQLELLAGNYELRIQVLRSPTIKNGLGKTEIVSAQLYLVYDYVNTAREVFLPPNLNFYGLFGYATEMVNFGQLTLFWDDLVLWNDKKETHFSVASNSMLTVHLEQDRKNVHVSLVTIDADGKPKIVGKPQLDVNYLGGSVENIYYELQKEIPYQLIISKDVIRNQDAVEEQEIGNRERSTFSLKLVLTETDALRQIKVDELEPKSFEEVAKERHSVPGLKESPFFLGTRETMQLFDELLQKDQNRTTAFQPKSSKVYSSKGGESVVARLPFKVKDSERIYAGLIEYTSVGLDLAIYSDDLQEEVSVSEQGKHFSLIDMAALPQGQYYLVVRNQNTLQNKSDKKLAVSFSLDVVRTIESGGNDWQKEFYSAIQHCPLYRSPDSLLQVGYLHPLSGNTLQTHLALSMLELDSGSNLPFTITEDSMVIVYVETPDDVEVALSIQSTGGKSKIVAISSDQDLVNQNFIHQKGYNQKNVVELRQFVGAGSYWISAQAVNFNGDVNMSFDSHQNFCDSYKVFLDIMPFTSAKINLNIGSVTDQEDFCEGQIRMPTETKIGQMVRGEIVTELKEQFMQVSYFDLTNLQQEGPFQFYFQLDYDPSQEGVVGITVSKFDKGSNSFAEQVLYSATHGQSTIMTILEIGVYVVSVQTVSSTEVKYGKIGFKQRTLVSNPCFRATYTYEIISINSRDLSMSPTHGQSQIAQISMMETNDDLKDLQAFQTCVFDKVPSKMPIGAFDKQYTLKLKQDQEDQIRIVTEEETLIKVFVASRNGVRDVVRLQLVTKAAPDVIIANDHAGVLTTFVQANEQGYLLRIIYEKVSDDECALFDLRIAAKELSSMGQENLQCRKYPLPPESLEVSEKEFRMEDTNFAFSGSYLKSQADSDHDTLQYDITVNFAHSDYYLDVELKTDFLTSNINMQLLSKDESDYHKIGLGFWVNENEEGNKNIDGSAFVQRFKFLDESQSAEKLKSSSTVVIRLQVRSDNLMIAKKLKETLCFNFELSIFAKETTSTALTTSNTNELIRVDFSPKSVDSSQTFDVTKNLFMYMEFESSMVKELVTVNTMYSKQIQAVFLQSTTEPNDKVYPVTLHLKKNDENTLEMKFNPNVLKKGKCYKVEIEKKVASSQKHDFELCTSVCSCNPIGTYMCDEKTQECVCHGKYFGSDCSKCNEGFSHQEDGTCTRETHCKSDGGKENCSGHGVCTQHGKTAKCACEPGFANDGLKQCGKCADPIFQFPDACDQRRNWVIKPSDHDCEDLPYKMPDSLFQDEKLESDDGSLEWSGRYNLKSQYVSHQENSKTRGKPATRTKSEHKFFVKVPSMFRLYINTLQEGVQVTYKITNVEGDVLFYRDTPASSIIEFDVINPQSGQDPKLSNDAPFTLHIKYTTTNQLDDCPQMEIHFILKPVKQHQASLKCTKQELKSHSYQMKSLYGEESEVQTYEIVLSSGMEVMEGNLISREDESFAYVVVDIEFQNLVGNTFTAFASYQFSDLHLSMALQRQPTNETIAVEKTEMLDRHENKDMLSYVETTNFEAGKYNLVIAVPKGYWHYTQKFETCLNFDLSMEFMKNQKQESLDLAESRKQDMKIVGVFPAAKTEMQIHSDFQIEIAAQSTNADFRTITQSLPDKYQICRLQNMVNQLEIIPASRVDMRNGGLKLNFQFSKENDRIRRHLNEQNGNCFKLLCQIPATKEPLIEGKIYQYCFAKDQIEAFITADSCNPFASAKFEHGECICPEPYSGKFCEQCVSGFQETANVWAKTKKSHTVCQPKTIDLIECNGYGVYQNGKCKCQKEYRGEHCEKCFNSTYLFPDCSDNYKSSIQSSKNLWQPFQAARDNLKTPQDVSIFAQECSGIDYPLDFNSLSFHREFNTGDFHFADVYTVNHLTNNFIKFTPRNPGSFKIMIKQPNLASEDDQETFDLSVGLYTRQQSNELLLVETNSDLTYGGDKTGKLDFAVLTVQIPQSFVDERLYIVFGTKKVTVVDDATSSKQCQQLYIEAEFRSEEYANKECNKSNIMKTQKPIKLKAGSPHRPEIAQSTISDGNWITLQDFYIDSDIVGGELTVSLEQKFIEINTIIPVLEMISTDVEWEQVSIIDSSKAKLECKKHCFVGEHKTYNQFTIIRDLPAGTHVRLWLFTNKKQLPNLGKNGAGFLPSKLNQCSNFQLTVRLDVPLLQDNKADESRCQISTPIPESLNTQGYLGESNDLIPFNRLIKVRVDNLPREGIRSTIRTFSERMWLRISGVYHEHLDFKLRVLKGLLEVASSSDNMVQEQIYPEPSLLILLEANQEYTFVLEFISEPHVLRQLCQFVEIQMAMRHEKLENSQQNKIPDYKFGDLTLKNMISEELVLFKLENSALSGSGDHTVLLAEEMIIEKGTDIVIQVSSGFLAADIQFALIRQDTKQVYLPKIRTDLSKTLVLMNSPVKRFKIVIFIRHSAKKQDLPTSSFPYFYARIDLFSTKSSKVTKVQLPNDKEYSANINFATQEYLHCLSRSDQFIHDLSTLHNYELKINIGGDSKPSYTFTPTHEQISIILNSAQFEFVMYLKDKQVAKSKKSPNYDFSELVVENLNIGQEYRLEINYIEESLTRFLNGKQCIVLSAFVTRGHKQQCHSTHVRDVLLPPVVPSLVSHQTVDIPMNQTIDLSITQECDIEVVVDYQRELYAPRLLIRDKSQLNSGNSLKEWMTNDKKWRSALHLEKSHQQIRYNNLKSGEYEVYVYYPNRPKEACDINTLVTIKSSAPLQEDFKLNNGLRISQHYQSKMDAAASIPTRLPLDLNSLKFLAFEKSGYLLFSDDLELSKDVNENTISIVVEEDDTLIRIYFEDNSLQINWMFEGFDQGYSHFSFFQKRLKPGTHVFTLKHLTSGMHQQRDRDDTVQVTISVAPPKFFENFQVTHYKSFQACERATFPLALQNNKEQSLTENQAYYSYNSLRLPQRVDEYTYLPKEVTTYFFRFNETQRFYFEVASQFVSSHAILKLSATHKENAYTLFGKQNGNINFIDTFIAAGDYQVQVFNYDSIHLDCGLYQFTGILNQISSMEISERGKQVQLGVSSCPIKGDFLPEIIYNSPDKTQHGNEEAVNQDGSYFASFENVLISSKQWSYQTEVIVLRQSILKVSIQSDVVDQMRIKLITSSGREQVPMLTDVVKTVGQAKELLKIWQIEAGMVYYIETVRTGGSQECDYFDAFIAISSFEYLQNELECDQNEKRLIDVLPETVRQKDMDLNITGTFRVDYPKDFEHLDTTRVVTPDSEEGLVYDIVIDSDSSYEFQANIRSEYALSDFVIGLYKIPEKNQPELDEIESQSSLKEGKLRDDRSMKRKLGPVTTSGKTFFAIQERQSKILFASIQKKYPNKNLCLSVDIKLHFIKREQATAVKGVPTLLEFSFVGEATTGETDINRFAQVPTIIQLKHNLKPLDLAESFSLALYGDDMKLLLRWKPISTKSSSQSQSSLTFQPTLSSQDGNISKQKALKVYLSYKNDLKTDSGESFVITEKFEKQLGKSHIRLQVSREERVREQIQEKDQNIETNTVKEKVKKVDAVVLKAVVICLCVHGTCKERETTCNKCDSGWSGTLCDIPKVKAKVNVVDEVESKVFKVKKAEEVHANVSVLPKTKRMEDTPVNYDDTPHSFVDQIDVKPTQQQITVLAGQSGTVISYIAWLTENAAILSGVGIVIYLLVLLRQKIQEKVLQLQEQQRRKKRNEYEGVLATDDDLEEHVPLELTSIHNKKSTKRRGQPSPSVKEYEEDAEQPKTLFDQDEMNPTHDDFDQTSKEIDDALLNLDDDDEGDETLRLI